MSDAEAGGAGMPKRKKSKPVRMSMVGAPQLKIGGKTFKFQFQLKDKLPILLPDNKFKNYWDALMFLVIFYNCNMTPIGITTAPGKPFLRRRLRQVDFAFDMLFVLDTLAGFCFAFKDKDTKELVTSQKAIGDSYLSSMRLKLNLLAVTLPNPISSVVFGAFLGQGRGGVCKALFAGEKAKNTRITRLSCLKAARLTRASRILLFFGQLQAVRVILEEKGVIAMNEASYRMLQIIVSLIFMCSFCGSFYFFLACNDSTPNKSPYCTYGNSTKPTGTWYDDPITGKSYRNEIYLENAKTWVGADAVFQAGDKSWDAVVARIMYFCMQTLFTIGYGDSVAPVSEREIWFSVVLMITGAMTYALVIANMTSVLANANVLYVRHMDEVTTMTQLLDDRDLPDGLKGRVKLSFEYMWSKQWGMLDRHLLGEMPHKLRELVSEPTTQLVKKIPWFDPKNRGGSDEFARALAVRLSTRIYIPNSTVVYAHEKQRELFVVRAGPILVFSIKSPTAIASLEAGDFFGDFQLVMDVKHPVMMKTGTSFAELFVASYEDYKHVADTLDIRVTEGDPAVARAGVVAMTEAYQKRLKAWQSANQNMAATADADDPGIVDVREMAAQGLEAGKTRIVFLPYDRIHRVWEPFLFASVFFMYLMIPLRAVLYSTDWKYSGRTGPSRDPTLLVEYVLDCFFWFDMYLRAFHFAHQGIVGGEEAIITDPDTIWRYYVKTFRFKVDLVTNMPWVLLALILTRATDGLDNGFALGPMWWAVARFPHLLRGLNFGVYLKDIREYLEIGEGIHIKDKTVTILQRTYETIFLVIFMACFWSIISSHGDGDGGPSFNSSFIRSFYYALVTFTTVGYGDVRPTSVSETWFVVLSGAIGATFFAGIVANITSFVHSVDISEDNIAHKRSVMSTFMEERALKPDTRRMIGAYFDYVENEKGGLDDLKLLKKSLAENMRVDVTLYLTHRVILTSKVFRGTEAGFLRRVMLALVQHYHTRDTKVVAQGEPAGGMCFIAAGDVDILLDGEQVNSLSVNGSFAEAAILDAVDAMPYTAKCTSYNEQWYLARVAFHRLLPEFPMVVAKLGDMGKRVRVYKPKKRGRGRPEKTGDASPRKDEGDKPSLASHKTRLPEGIMHPQGLFMHCWSFLLLFFVVWNMLLVPFKVCFMDGFGIEQSVRGLMAVDYLGDLVMLVDMVLQARCVAYYDGDTLVVSRRKIWRRYRASKWKAHALCAVPLDLLYFTHGSMPSGFLKYFSRVQFLSIFRVNKLIRFSEVVDLVKRCEDALNAVGLKLNKNSVRLTRLVFAILISSHFFGSIFYAIAHTRGKASACVRYRRRTPRGDKFCGNWAQDRSNWPPNLLDVEFREGIGFPNPLGLAGLDAASPAFSVWGTRKPKWDVEYSLFADKYLWKQYVNAFYWGAATITTVGYGDISPTSLAEIIFAIICIIMAVIIYTLIIANLEDIVANLDVTSTLMNIKREKVKQWCLRSYLPEATQISIFDYYDKLWAQQRGVSGSELLLMLPENLRAHVVLELAGALVKQLPFVRDCRPHIRYELALRLDLDLYMPKDWLFHAGECAWQIFFVFFGRARLVDENSGSVVQTLENAAIGTAEFFLRTLYPLSGQASDYSQIFVLRYADLVKVLKDNGLLQPFKEHCIGEEKAIAAGGMDSAQSGLKVGANLSGGKKKAIAADVVAHSKFLVDPSSLFKRLWLILCLAGMCYYLISVPFEIAFAKHYKRQSFVIDVMLMCLYSVDIILNLTVFMVKKQGKLIRDPKQFRAIYVDQYFTSDVIGLIPISIFVVLFQQGSFDGRFQKKNYRPVVNAWRLIQVLRVNQAPLYGNSLVAFMEENFGIHLNGDMIYLIVLTFIVLVMCHWLACLLYALGRWELWYARAGADKSAFGGSSSDWGANMKEAFKWYKDDAYGCRNYVAQNTGTEPSHLLPSAPFPAANIWLCGPYIPDTSQSVAEQKALDRWLVSFYWAMYTCSTIGYGSIPMHSNAEKLLSCLAMILGAIVCDAGITAVLTAFIEHKDHQAGTNKRRMDCATRMMAAANVEPGLQARVRDYFTYVDTELYNLNEQDVLAELNVALRNSILHGAAHLKLCDSLMYGGFEAGIVATMVYTMRTVVAVPQEKILQIGQPDPSLYIFQSGTAHAVDGCGDEEYVAVGTILSNSEFKQVAKRVGVPTKQITCRIDACRNLPAQASVARRMMGASVCDPFVEVVVVSKTVFGQSVKTCQTNVRKFTTEPEFKQRFVLKAYQNTEHAHFTVFHWRRGLAAVELGKTEVSVKQKYRKRGQWHKLRDARGRRVGDIKLYVEFAALERSGIANTAELTVIADSFCHLYFLDFGSQEKVKKYIKGMRLPAAKRLEALTPAKEPDWRPHEEALDAMTGGDDEMSLCSAVANSRGFEAYMSEAFSKRSTKGSVMQVNDGRRRSSLGTRKERAGKVQNKIVPVAGHK